MGGRGVRIALIVSLLVAAFASISAPVSGADETRDRFDRLGTSILNGYFSSGQVHHPDVSRPIVRAEEPRDPQVVVGQDTRSQVTETAQFPYSAIAHLELYEASESGEGELVAICSAAFVGPNVLLTAAHCLWDDVEFGGFVDRVVVVPGANGEIEPFGFIDAEWLWIPDAYTTNSEAGSPYDYGIIVLPTTDVEEQTGSFEIGILTTGELQDPAFNPTTAGYPGDKPFGTQWISSEAAFSSVDDDGLVHNIDSVPGQSGSPVWRASDMAIVGVESAESDFENLAVRLDVPIMYELMAACQELDCKLNHFLTDVPGDEGAYDRVWERTDLPVALGMEPRTWMWGPDEISKIMFEPYVEAPNGFRTVLYQEKSRMEITDPGADSNSIWYVTNGLATVELMTGNLQLGNNTFEQHEPATINVAGDGDDPTGPTYATFGGLRTLPPHGQGTTPGTVITATVDRSGTVGENPSLAAEGVTTAHYVPETQHMVASVFWEFMNSSGTVWQNGQYVEDLLFDNPFFATGFPVTEAYWATVRVGGNERTVLVQAFERRVLTYTPGNPEGFLVEAGNVGAHMLTWLEIVTRPESSNGGGPAPPSDNPPPAIGSLLGSFDLASVGMIDLPIGTGEPIDGAYRISNPPLGFLQILGQGAFDDGLFTVESRLVQPSAVAGAACILYRSDPVDDNPLLLESGYWFCLVYEGANVVAAQSYYETTQDVISLGGVEFVEPLPVGTEWHKLSVVAEGSEFWFLLDDLLLGSIEHDIGPGSGQIGILTINLDENEAGPEVVFDLRNLEVYGLESSSEEPPQPPSPPGGTPVEGDILYQTTLGDLPAVEGVDGAYGEPSESGSGYIVIGPPGSAVAAIADVSFGDASYEVELITVTEGGDASSCLMVRMTDTGTYNLCLAYSAGSSIGTLAFYLDLVSTTEPLVDLGVYAFSSPRPSEQVQTIKVITRGPDFWFFAGDQLVGSATHGTGSAGAVGISMICVDDVDVCGSAFSNLVVRSLAN